MEAVSSQSPRVTPGEGAGTLMLKLLMAYDETPTPTGPFRHPLLHTVLRHVLLILIKPHSRLQGSVDD